MNASDWLDLTVLERKKYNYLSETMDLTEQLGEALDRNDQVSVKMLLAMRQDPIRCLSELRSTVEERRQALNEEDRARVSALLAGEPPRSGEEQAFQQQTAVVSRLLERVVELDRRISLRVAGKSSFYQTAKPL